MFHSVVQVYPTSDFTVYVYFADGHIRLYDVRPLIERGGVFSAIADVDVFLNTCTVMNSTLAWDLSGSFDATTCLDIDSETIYQTGQATNDPLTALTANSEA